MSLEWFAETRKAFLGQGLAFPLHVDVGGGIALVTGLEDIEQAIQIILGTMPGERVMRPEFGCRAWELVFAPNNAATRALLGFYVEQALAFWEPRITVDRVTVDAEPEAPSALNVTVEYTVKDTHDPRSIVYPFFLMGEENA